jgi:hypothetical protein
MTTLAEEFIATWNLIKGLPHLKFWMQKYLTVEQQRLFEEEQAALQEVWMAAKEGKGGMSVATTTGNGSFDPHNPNDPVLNDVDYFGVEFTMLPENIVYAVYIPYVGDEIKNPIGCLPDEHINAKLH